MKARAIAILGTGSDVGKSLITAAICRLLHRSGVHVAPFKAQNMSLNSFVTPGGHEIGRAQALQAEACGIPPHVDLNPILLKPESDNCSQVVVLGKVCGKREASVYFDSRQELWSVVEDSYARLANQYDMLVIEGAGSAAEVNLREHDLVNWPVAKLADAQVVLVADIDRGGVFAQVLGTLDLLAPDERAMVRGVIINKFRGDARLFADGVKFLEERSGLPVLGVVPFLRDLMLDQEDSLDLDRNSQTRFAPDRLNIAVILLPHMSNFTDFNILGAEPDVALKYVASPSMLAEADIVLIPGSKNTLADLSYLQENGYIPALDHHLHGRRELVGICGGYQMLGRWISDPHGVEQGGASRGLGYLNTETELKQAKRTTQVEANAEDVFAQAETMVRGYQIHMGVTRLVNELPCFKVRHSVLGENARLSIATGEAEFDGAVRKDGLVWGTYIHGVFDESGFRRAWLNRARVRKGLPPLDELVSRMVTVRSRGELDRWADHVSHNLDLTSLVESLHT
ncbi:MAG: cobyric acid synthase [Nitrospira sp. LK265]|nr:cobyric acid synthase [Nitrospira sp.]NGZ60864.1 cobyric acid synthase [Nitrospira sp. LK265]